ncbi:MAG: lipoyl(octanoyl) transferase LipB [Pseudomonadota bacterium]
MDDQTQPPTEAQAAAVAWIRTPGLTAYPDAVAQMEARVAAIADGSAREAVWLVEHPPLYTAGTSAQPADLLAPGRFPVFETGRGGQFTYHGPGQQVAYVMLDLKRRGRDVRAFVRSLETWLIAALRDGFGVAGGVRDGRIGVWVARDGEAAAAQTACDEKIAAIGIRVRHWVSFHGVSLNVAPDLSHFDGIVPCGIADHGVTSLAALGHDTSAAHVDDALRRAFEATFALTTVVENDVAGAPAHPDARETAPAEAVLPAT